MSDEKIEIDLSLESVGDGAAKELFETELDEIRALFADPYAWEENAKGIVTAKIVLEVDVSLETASGALGSRIRSKLVRPKRRPVATPHSFDDPRQGTLGE